MLKLISLNIESHKHFDLQLPFFLKESPDILCLQEVLESDFNFLKSALAMEGSFASMCFERRIDNDGKETPEPRGVALLTKLPIDKTEAYYYFGDPKMMHEVITGITPQEKINKVLLLGSVAIGEGRAFFFGTTHFTWSKGGEVNDRQRQDLQMLLQKLSTIPEIVFCGDFNSPRGGEIFGVIAEKYKDNIPMEHITSIDGNLHRHGPLQFMVDGLFSTPGYRVTNVRLQGGVSDHYAIVADISHA